MLRPRKPANPFRYFLSSPEVIRLLERKPTRLVTVAMANKTARIVWAVLARGEAYRPAVA